MAQLDCTQERPFRREAASAAPTDVKSVDKAIVEDMSEKQVTQGDEEDNVFAREGGDVEFRGLSW